MIHRRHRSRYTVLFAVVGLLAAVLVAVPGASVAQVPTPRLLIELPVTAWWDGSQWVDGYVLEGDGGWPIGATVDISAKGLPQGSVMVADPATNPNEFSLILPASLALMIGDQITASIAGGPSATLTVPRLTIESVDIATNVITGTADVGDGPFEVGIGGGNAAQGSFTAGGTGIWTVDGDSLTPVLDVQPGNDVYARMDDGGGNLVDYWLYLPKLPQNVQFAVYPYEGSSNYIWGGGWSRPVDIVIDDDANPGNGTLFDYPDFPINPDGSFGAQSIFDTFQIQRGQFVTVTDGTNTKTHQVFKLWIDSFDFENDRILGRAAPDSEIEVLTGPPGDERSVGRNVVADGSGNWTADFSQPGSGGHPFAARIHNIVPGTDATANQTDIDGDMTGADVVAPPEPAPLNIGITLPARDWWDEPNWVPIHGYLLEASNWPEGESISISVRNTIGAEVYSTSINVGDSIFNHGTPDQFALVLPTAVGLQPGFEIEASSASAGPLVLTVQDVTITGYDLDNNTVTGRGAPDTQVDGIHVCGGFGCEDAWGPFPVDGLGDWGPIDIFAINPVLDLDLGMDVAARMYDNNGLATEYLVSIPNPPAEPFLHANVYGDEFIHGNNFDTDELRVIEITNDNACTGRVYTNEWEWQFDGSQFCDDGDLKPGHRVTISTVQPDGVTPNAVLRELLIHDVVITGADIDSDSVSGLATPGLPVLVGIVDEPGNPFSFQAQRVVDPDPAGVWSVGDFNVEQPVGDSDNWGQIEIDGQEVKAFQFDEDGDFTTSDWWQADPRLYVNLLDNYVMLQGWPTGTSILVDVFEYEGDPAPIASETIDASGPYYRFDTETDLGIDLLSGHHVVASSGTVVLSHTVTELAITTFDFPGNSFTGTAFSTGTTVAAGAWNDGGEGEVGGLSGPMWTADFTGQVDFRQYNRIGGYVAEFDAAQNATFFMFEATYEELTVEEGETSVTTGDGSVTIDNLGEGDAIEIITGPPSECPVGFECVGDSIDIPWDEPPRSVENGDEPLILTLRLSGEGLPPNLSLDDILVFKDGVQVADCILPLDRDDDFPCVSDRIWEGGDVKLTVQTLSFSVWTTAIRGVRIAEFDSVTGPVEVDTEVTASAAVQDVGMVQPGSLTAAITWGNGACEVVPIGENGGITSAHTYDRAGVYGLQLDLYAGTAVNCDAASSLTVIDTASYQYVVVYDPNGGFVTGGGWIDSPLGAYAPDPSLTGTATFGFVSKYQKGATVPTGNTEFIFQVADLEFHSTSYDWLVIAGHQAKYKGTGTINGSGDYGFMLTATDAALTPSTDVDGFRIKIWDKDDGDAVVYDNEMDAADDADATTELGGGSIVIHKAKQKAT